MLLFTLSILFAVTQATQTPASEAEILANEAKATAYENQAAVYAKQATAYGNYGKQVREMARKKRADRAVWQARMKQVNKVNVTNTANPNNTVTVSTPVTINNTNKNDNKAFFFNSPKVSPQTTVGSRPTNGFVPLGGQKPMVTVPSATTSAQPAFTSTAVPAAPGAKA